MASLTAISMASTELVVPATNMASGANHGLRWLSVRTVRSTVASSPVRMAVT